ncbi:SDR family NAD(P)-dependent oxidoreductase [Clostridium bovifaecis]|uniref:SDR family NAD(P)-dependent oxidoreductase n=1 Tax=Clostridium bovifaecis TaxID=2184719 RepID=A0A6I6EQQ1_9CLOT|nr:SDR family NAD(P)-dependent oxidoreductase [Clostridium bovifaecis]
MIKDYKDKIVVVTGAANGIGKQLALGCAKRGAHLVINDIHGDEAEKVAQEIRDMGQKAVAVQADVSLNEECKRIFDVTMETYGHVDVLINNAGVSAFGDVTEIVEQDIHWVTEVNVYSHWYMMGHFIPQMKKQGNHCQIVNVCSIAGLITLSSAPVYFSTKHAAVALSESTYKWLKETNANIDLAVFCPGFVQTEMYLTDRHRPARYSKNDNPFYTSKKYEEYNKMNRYVLDTGRELEPVIEEVFQALNTDNFFILTHDKYDSLIRNQGIFQADKVRPITPEDIAPKE